MGGARGVPPGLPNGHPRLPPAPPSPNLGSARFRRRDSLRSRRHAFPLDPCRRRGIALRLNACSPVRGSGGSTVAPNASGMARSRQIHRTTVARPRRGWRPRGPSRRTRRRPDPDRDAGDARTWSARRTRRPPVPGPTRSPPARNPSGPVADRVLQFGIGQPERAQQKAAAGLARAVRAPVRRGEHPSSRGTPGPADGPGLRIRQLVGREELAHQRGVGDGHRGLERHRPCDVDDRPRHRRHGDAVHLVISSGSERRGVQPAAATGPRAGPASRVISTRSRGTRHRPMPCSAAAEPWLTTGSPATSDRGPVASTSGRARRSGCSASSDVARARRRRAAPAQGARAARPATSSSVTPAAASSRRSTGTPGISSTPSMLLAHSSGIARLLRPAVDNPLASSASEPVRGQPPRRRTPTADRAGLALPAKPGDSLRDAVGARRWSGRSQLTRRRTRQIGRPGSRRPTTSQRIARGRRPHRLCAVWRTPVRCAGGRRCRAGTYSGATHPADTAPSDVLRTHARRRTVATTPPRRRSSRDLAGPARSARSCGSLRGAPGRPGVFRPCRAFSGLERPAWPARTGVCLRGAARGQPMPGRVGTSTGLTLPANPAPSTDALLTRTRFGRAGDHHVAGSRPTSQAQHALRGRANPCEVHRAGPVCSDLAGRSPASHALHALRGRAPLCEVTYSVRRDSWVSTGAPGVRDRRVSYAAGAVVSASARRGWTCSRTGNGLRARR